jgi:gluconokinase
MWPAEALVVTLDIGTSSVRTLLFDGRGRQHDRFGEQIHYQFTPTADGGVEMDADQLLDLTLRSFRTLHEQVRTAGLQPSAVAFSSFWHSLMGVDREGKPTTPLLHLFDTRSAKQVDELAHRLDPKSVHARTGCVLHSSYWPAKLLWLSETRPDAFRATDRWISFGEYLFLKLFGTNGFPAIEIARPLPERVFRLQRNSMVSCFGRRGLRQRR